MTYYFRLSAKWTLIALKTKIKHPYFVISTKEKSNKSDLLYFKIF